MPLLFDRFHRVAGSRSRTHEGSGIGLALVAELVDLHQGTVEVTSELHRGSTLHRHAPPGPRPPAGRAGRPRRRHARGHRRRPDAQHGHPDPQLAARGRGTGGRSGTARPRSPRARTARTCSSSTTTPTCAPTSATCCADQLRASTVAADGAQALERLAERLPDLVLTDVMMPRLDGFGLLRATAGRPRADRACRSSCSRRARARRARVEGLEAGANDYLVKPFSARELLARVRVNLELDRAQRLRARPRAQRGAARPGPAAGPARQLGDRPRHRHDHRLATSSRPDADAARGRSTRIGTTAVIASLVTPTTSSDVNARLGGAVPGELVDYETRIVTRDGRERIFRLRGEVVGPTPPTGDGRAGAARLVPGRHRRAGDPAAARRRRGRPRGRRARTH